MQYLILKSSPRNTNQIVDPFTQVKIEGARGKIQHKITPSPIGAHFAIFL